MKKLPDKLSDLLLVALEDLEKTEADPRYRINMGIWHGTHGDDGLCYVCLAGSVMARRLDASIQHDISPFMFRGEIANKLQAINYMRLGEVDFSGGLGGEPENQDSMYSIAEQNQLSDLSYLPIRTAWLNHMLDLVGVLQAEGL